jgi:ABC-type uncharacterized transport system substrate-binding protein
MRTALFHLALVAASVAAASAHAHPHVWVTMTEELLYAPDGSVIMGNPCGIMLDDARLRWAVAR